MKHGYLTFLFLLSQHILPEDTNGSSGIMTAALIRHRITQRALLIIWLRAAVKPNTLTHTHSRYSRPQCWLAGRQVVCR